MENDFLHVPQKYLSTTHFQTCNRFNLFRVSELLCAPVTISVHSYQTSAMDIANSAISEFFIPALLQVLFPPFDPLGNSAA